MKPQARTDIKQMLKNADDVEVPMDPQYYRRLHDKIMMKIDDEPLAQNAVIIPIKLRRNPRELSKKY